MTDFTSRPPSVLVTGSTGFLGGKIVETLIRKGFEVRAFARNASKISNLKALGVKVFMGDIRSVVTLRPAFQGVDYVVHAAADTTGSDKGGKESTIAGTENILSLCLEYDIKKLIYISSCSVYGVTDYAESAEINESGSLERFPEKRGSYSEAKFKAEQAVVDAMEGRAFPIVCLRPGTIYGPGGELYTPMLGLSLGGKIFLIIGDGTLVLPLVYIDNIADAVAVAIKNEKSNGNIFNVVDPYRLTKDQYIKLFVKTTFPYSLYLNFPYSFLYFIAWGLEIIAKICKGSPLLTRYRLESSQKKVVYDGSKIQKELGWIPPASLREAIEGMTSRQQIL